MAQPLLTFEEAVPRRRRAMPGGGTIGTKRDLHHMRARLRVAGLAVPRTDEQRPSAAGPHPRRTATTPG